jgi:hypothetical protein
MEEKLLPKKETLLLRINTKFFSSEISFGIHLLTMNDERSLIEMKNMLLFKKILFYWE